MKKSIFILFILTFITNTGFCQTKYLDRLYLTLNLGLDNNEYFSRSIGVQYYFAKNWGIECYSNYNTSKVGYSSQTYGTGPFLKTTTSKLINQVYGNSFLVGYNTTEIFKLFYVSLKTGITAGKLVEYSDIQYYTVSNQISKSNFKTNRENYVGLIVKVDLSIAFFKKIGLNLSAYNVTSKNLNYYGLLIGHNIGKVKVSKE